MSFTIRSNFLIAAFNTDSQRVCYMASANQPTRFDYLAPFNPRGDGYQVPSSSSTGSAVASAAYTWLDFTIGTDTGGSIRHPAGVNGTYGLRPSLSAVSSTGVMSVSTILDTVGLFARSALILEPVLKAMADPIIPTLPLPTSSTKYKLIYPIRAKDAPPKDNLRWFPHPDQPGTEAVVEARFEEVVRSLEAHLKCKRHVINMDELWRTARPAGQPETLDAATGLIYRALTSYNSVRHNIDPFVSAHKAACGGAAPFIDPIVRARLEHGRTMTDSEYAAAVESGKIFGKWVRDVVLSPSPSSSEEEEPYPLLVFPQSFGLPVYRDEPDPSAPIFHTSFSIYSLSYLSGAPDCTVPVGEVLRRSRISQKEMWLPVSLSVVGRVGSEAGLVKLLGELERGGVIRGVEVGERMGWGECRG